VGHGISTTVAEFFHLRDVLSAIALPKSTKSIGYRQTSTNTVRETYPIPGRQNENGKNLTDSGLQKKSPISELLYKNQMVNIYPSDPQYPHISPQIIKKIS
jgi:hypothetical protein